MRASRSLTQLFLSIHVALLLVFVAACAPPSGSVINVVAPSNGSSHGSPPQFIVSYVEEPVNPILHLNGARVDQYFNFGANQGTADGEVIQSFLRQGENTFQANPPFGSKSTFLYDSMGPKVVIKYVSDTNPINVVGRLVDPAGGKTISINGTTSSVDAEGEFLVVVDPAPVYEIVATDNLDKNSTIHYVAPGTVFDRIVTSRVSQDAMDFIAQEVGPMLSEVDLNPILPIFNEELSNSLQDHAPLIEALADIEITNLHFNGSLSASLDPKPSANDGVIGFDADITDIVADVTAYTLFGWIEIPVTASIASANAIGDAHVDGVDGKIAVSISGLNLSTSNIGISIANNYSHLISSLANALLPVLEGAISFLIEDIMNAILDRMLSEIGDQLVVDINGVQLGMSPLFQSFSSDDETLHVVLGGKLEALTFNETIPPVLGSLYVDDPLPDAPDIGSHLVAAVSSNLINQAFMSAYQAGIHHFTIINQSEILIGIDRDDEGYEQGTERWLIDPGQPAYFRVEDTGGDPAIFLVLDGLSLTIQRRGVSQWVDAIYIDMDVEARVILGVNPDDTLRVSFAGLPIITLNDARLTGLSSIDKDLVDLVLQNSILPRIMGDVAEATESIELPAILGYRIIVDDFMALGDEGSHLGLGVTLRKTP